MGASRRRTFVALLVGATALLIGAGFDAFAQVPLPTLPSSTTTTKPPRTTTTTRPRSTTTTTLVPGSSTTTQPGSTTTEPSDGNTTTTRRGAAKKKPGGSATTSTLVPPAPGDVPGGGGGDISLPELAALAQPAGAPVVPPDAQALINSVVRTGPSNTKKLLQSLEALEDFGLTPSEAALTGMGRFPIAGYASYVHDWLYPRFVPTFHFHQGTDIFAAHGTPVRAPANGVVRITNGKIGGLAVYVNEPDGTYWYLAHLSGLKAGLAEGQAVRVGQVVGYVGDSGNARGGAPHVHFEVHPTGGGPIDPKPILDRFLADAVKNVPRLIQWYEQRQPRGLVGTGLVRRLLDTDAGDLVVAGSGPSRSQLLWASSANPAGGALQLAEAEAVAAARTVNWEQRAQREQERMAAWAAANQASRNLLAPLSTDVIAAVMSASTDAS